MRSRRRAPLRRGARHNSDSGFVLATTLLLLLLIGAISTAAVFLVNTESQMGFVDSENSRAYYAAEAGMEKMVADLDELYAQVESPTVEEIQALGALPPSILNVTYTDYSFIVPNTGGVPETEIRNISSGPYGGLTAEVLALDLVVEARQNAGAEVRMERQVQVAMIPLFQFGIFSDTDLSYFPGPDFDFGGRVHTNGNLFLAAGSSGSLVFHSKVTASGEVIRAEVANGLPIGGLTGTVYLPTAPNGCDGSRPACRLLGVGEGSRTAGPQSSENPDWDNLSTSVYNGMISNGATGARNLDLPFVSSELTPVEIIRRPAPGEDSSSLMSQSRLYAQAHIRVLLSDDPADLPGGAGDPQNIRLARVIPYDHGVNVVGVGDTFFAEAKTSVDSDWVPPAGGADEWALLDGYLRVEAKRASGYSGVTREWLELGFARGLTTPNSEAGITNTVHPSAILILQKQADRNLDGDLDDAEETTEITGKDRKRNWFPINLYDTREGEVRDIGRGSTDTSCAIGGVMNLVELDVGNLRSWLRGSLGSTGNQTLWGSGGYILYFSDRRGMLPGSDGNLTGEYGFEDVVNGSYEAGTPNGTLDPGEDVNENNQLDAYGRANLGDAFFSAAQGGDTAYDGPTTRIDCPTTARKNRVSGARHAIKLINGSTGNLPSRPDGPGGFTLASENPVYLRGNYNANSSGFDGSGVVPAAVIADAVTVLSNNWEDWQSFRHPTYVGSYSERMAVDTWYQVAIAAGKSRPWPNPGWDSGNMYGLDGGTHNFLRYLENWSGKTLTYRGSLASLYFSRYAVGVYKCCATVYSAPARDYSFDTSFLDLASLPPGTPRFRDLVNLGFRQIFDVDYDPPAAIIEN